MNRVVLTGIGIYSCIGKNIEEAGDSLRKGRSGVVFDEERKKAGFRSALTGKVEKPDLKGLLDRKLRVNLPEQGEYAYLAGLEALRVAKLDEGALAAKETGIIIGNDSSVAPTLESAAILEEKKNTTLIGSKYIFQSMNSTVSMNLAVIFKLKGVNFTVSAACASGSHAIGMAYILVKNGYQDRILCGGAQETNWRSMMNFDALSAFSARETDPAGASRPFDRDRDGLVPSGGAACVVMETLESAKARGSEILAEVLGYGFSSDGCHIIKPEPDGAKRAMENAVADAGIKLSEIDYINAHATSTPAGDASEARAIAGLFGALRPVVSSTKSMTGHECWMAGASEVVYSVIMMREGFIAPNINFENPDEDSAKLNIAAKTLAIKPRIVLSNSFGFGGTNSALLISCFKG
jgi:3-oxoacyl-[acyl-carrier-protein] synthase-1